MRILISKSRSCLIDDEDEELVTKYRWYGLKSTLSTSYAVTCLYKPKKTTVYMHRLIMGVTDPRIKIDHINGNGLDNRRTNLRLCTQEQNMRNRGKMRRNTSGYKGVFWSKTRGNWTASIRVFGKLKYLGAFATPQEADEAYKIASRKYFKEFSPVDRQFPEGPIDVCSEEDWTEAHQ